MTEATNDTTSKDFCSTVRRKESKKESKKERKKERKKEIAF